MYAANTFSNARDATTAGMYASWFPGITLIAAGSSPQVSIHASAARHSPGSETFARSPVSARWSGACARRSTRNLSSSSILCFRRRLTIRFSAPSARLFMKSVGPTPASDPRKCGSVTCASRNIPPRSGRCIRRLRDHLHVGDDAEVVRHEHALAAAVSPGVSNTTRRVVDHAAPIAPDLRREDVVERAVRRSQCISSMYGLALAQVTPVAACPVRARPASW
jgi:hypothetical protein